MDNHLFLGHDKLEVLAHHFKVIDTHGAILFAVDKNEVAVGANALRIDGDGGAMFRESIQTPLIRAEPGKELKYVLLPAVFYIIFDISIMIKCMAIERSEFMFNSLAIWPIYLSEFVSATANVFCMRLHLSFALHID